MDSSKRYQGALGGVIGWFVFILLKVNFLCVCNWFNVAFRIFWCTILTLKRKLGHSNNLNRTNVSLFLAAFLLFIRIQIKCAKYVKIFSPSLWRWMLSIIQMAKTARLTANSRIAFMVSTRHFDFTFWRNHIVSPRNKSFLWSPSQRLAEGSDLLSFTF